MSKSQTYNVPQKWLNSKQAGDYVGLSNWTIRDYCKRGLIEHTRLPGGDYRLCAEWLDAFMESRAAKRKQSLVVPKPEPLKVFDGTSRFAQAIKKVQQKRMRCVK